MKRTKKYLSFLLVIAIAVCSVTTITAFAIKDNQENIVKFEPHNEWVGTQEEFDALETKDPKITYYITKS